MVNPGQISCHNSVQNSISFTSMTGQMLLTNHLPCTLLITGQLPWDPSATHLPIPDVIMDRIAWWAVTHVQFYGDFINVDSTSTTGSLLDLLFYCLSCHANWAPTPVFITDVFIPFWNLSTHSYTLPWLKQMSPYWMFVLLWISEGFYTLWPQKTNNASLLFHGAIWQWSGHVVRAIAQAQTARSSRPLYGILLRSHFVSRNKIFRCAYFSLHFRIKFLLFNDFPSYFKCSLSWFDLSKKIRRGIPSMKILITQSFLPSCKCLSLRSTNFHGSLISILTAQDLPCTWETQFHTHTNQHVKLQFARLQWGTWPWTTAKKETVLHGMTD